MAFKTVRICDKCGEVLEPTEPLYPVKIFNGERKVPTWDVCEHCKDKLWDWLCNGGSGMPGPFGPNTTEPYNQ